jgi:hypothetical protein
MTFARHRTSSWPLTGSRSGGARVRVPKLRVLKRPVQRKAGETMAAEQSRERRIRSRLYVFTIFYLASLASAHDAHDGAHPLPTFCRDGDDEGAMLCNPDSEVSTVSQTARGNKLRPGYESLLATGPANKIKRSVRSTITRHSRLSLMDVKLPPFHRAAARLTPALCAARKHLVSGF